MKNGKVKGELINIDEYVNTYIQKQFKTNKNVEFYKSMKVYLYVQFDFFFWPIYLWHY